MGQYCGRCGSLLADSFAVCPRCNFSSASSFPAAGHSPNSSADTLAMAGVPAGLAHGAPVEVRRDGSAADIAELQGLHLKVLAQGDSIAQSFGSEPTGIVKVVAWMVRATFLDKRVARAAAQDTGGNGAAIAALAIAAIPSIIFGALFNGFRMGFVAGLGTTIVLAAVTPAIVFFSLSLLSARIIDIKLPAGTVLRVLAYPQAIMAVSAIPILGGFIGPVARIWSIVASAEAIREVTGTRAEKAIIFTAIGALIQACVWMVLSILAARAAMLLQIR